MNDRDHDQSHSLERLVFFSDAVFAIAITLLIIEVRPPLLPAGASDREQLAALASIGPSFFSFFVSFAVIGAFWSSHHRVFGLANGWSPKLMRPNMLLLLLIVLMPFTTAYMGTNWGERVPAILYDSVLVLAGLVSIYLARIVTSPPVVAEYSDPVTIARSRARGWGAVAGAGLALTLAFVRPSISQFGLLLIPVGIRVAVACATSPFASVKRRKVPDPSLRNREHEV